MESSSFGRLIGVLVDPAKTFRALRDNPAWVVAFLVLLALSAVVGYLVVERIDPAAQEAAVREMFEERGMRGAELERQVEAATSINRRIAPFLPVFGVVFSIIAYLVIAGLFLVGARLLGGAIGFKQSLATSLHALMPQAVGALLTIPVVLAQGTVDPEAAQAGNLLPSNLAFLAPEDAHWSLEVLLGSLDFFSLWTLVLLAIGYRIVAGLSRNAAIGLTVTFWLLWIVTKLGFAALGNLGG